MNIRRRLTFWIDEWQGDALKDIKERDGVPEAEQIRRALVAWFEERGIKKPSGTGQPGGRTRKRGR